MGVRECALECVIFAGEHLRKFGQATRHDFQAAGIMHLQRVATTENMNRRSLFGSRFREGENARGEVKGGQRRVLAANLDAARLWPSRFPMQPAGDHQVQDEIQVIIETPDDALSQPEHVVYSSAVQLAQGRLVRSQKKWAADFRLLQHLSPNPRPQPFDVDRNVGKLRHSTSLLKAQGRKSLGFDFYFLVGTRSLISRIQILRKRTGSPWYISTSGSFSLCFVYFGGLS